LLLRAAAATATVRRRVLRFRFVVVVVVVLLLRFCDELNEKRVENKENRPRLTLRRAVADDFECLRPGRVAAAAAAHNGNSNRSKNNNIIGSE